MSTFLSFKPTPAPLISLEAARADPSIVYHSVRHLDRLPAVSDIPYPPRRAPVKLVSLSAARKDPRIVYRSIEHLENLPPLVITAPQPPPRLQSSMRLVPLYVAAAQSSIKYRKEGFEMEEHRRHILAVRTNMF